MALQETVFPSSQGNSAESIDSELTEAEPQLPWPFLGKWVQYKAMVGDSYIFQCLSCLPKIIELKVNKGTKANLKSHFNRIHPDDAKQVNEACVANVGTRGRRRGQFGQSANGGSTSKKQRQMSIAETCSTVGRDSVVLQSTVDNTIVRFVVDNMLPLQVLDSQSFRDMVHTLNPSKEVPSRRTLGMRILKTYEEMKESLTTKLEQVKWVGTSTADYYASICDEEDDEEDDTESKAALIMKLPDQHEFDLLPDHDSSDVPKVSDGSSPAPTSHQLSSSPALKRLRLDSEASLNASGSSVRPKTDGDDGCAAFAKMVGGELKAMDLTQRTIAKKLINEALYHGLMGVLHASSAVQVLPCKQEVDHRL